ncbi:DNA-3-methyladenine glycosidase [Intrasporangium oryzae NRRL B-24470]|uniref:Putative 3-methyladenine DNA glycosylase n=1 Tax=Intrasporangium oryzae NRRL B-24470 TaxID=1386089 RepID=W9GBG3_9MICO|nr:DNA-3-methyladenine glycosylase [Intrasporangium oryzae]EWT01209.1 DNA-3-methyladenine glycosidase [Intrasporangium oryzae NRRL B-24470]
MSHPVRSGERLPRAFFARSSLDVAPDLLGCLLTFGEVTLRLTELEAYAGHLDPGSHAFRGETPRTRPMFGPAGFTYVYFTYGHHWCLNLVAGQEGTAEAVLVRGAEVVAGHDVVAVRRAGVRQRDWARGPGRLAQALGMNGEHTGRDFCRPSIGEPIDLVVAAPLERVPEDAIRTGPRVGVSGPGGDGEAYPWRFFVDGDPHVSTYRPGVVRRRRTARGPR